MTTVERPITLRLGSTHAVAAVLRYDAEKPLDVVLDAAGPNGARIPWRFPRSLLAAGMKADGLGMVGSGEVMLYRRGLRLFLRLRGEGGFAEAWVFAAEVGAFLAATYRLVPDGAEVSDFDPDAELAALLGSGGAS